MISTRFRHIGAVLNALRSSILVALALALAFGAGGCALFDDPSEVPLDRADSSFEPTPDMGNQPDVGSTDMRGDLDLPSDAGGDSGEPSLCPGADLQADANNCGACGTRCFGECRAGTCAAYIVADEQASPYGIDVDSSHVYWSNKMPGSVWRAPVAGGDPELLADENADGRVMNPRFLHLTATDVIVSVENAGTLGHGTPLFRIAKSGGVASGFGGPVADGTEDFAIRDGVVYSAFPRLDLINAAPIGRGAASLAEGNVPDAYSVAFVGDTLYFAGGPTIGTIDQTDESVTILPTSGPIEVSQIRSDGARLFVAANNEILVVENGALTRIQSALFECESIAFSGETVVFATGNDEPSGSIFRMDKDGSNLSELVGRIPHIEQIAADERNVWVVSEGEDDSGSPMPGTGRILRVPLEP